MRGTKPSDISKFFIAGINYRKTDASVRGSFAIGNEQYEKILLLAPSFGISELFVLSTCNRTEIYGVVEDAAILIDLLCTQTMGAKNRVRCDTCSIISIGFSFVSIHSATRGNSSTFHTRVVLCSIH